MTNWFRSAMRHSFWGILSGSVFLGWIRRGEHGVAGLGGVLCIVALGGFGVSCAQLTKQILKDPKITVKAFNVTNVSLQELSLDLDLDVENPNPVPLSLDQVSYSLRFSGENVTEGVFQKGIEVPAQGTSVVTVPLTFKYNALGNLLMGSLNRSLSRDYELKGSVKMGFFTIPFSKKGEVQLPKK